MRLELDPFLTEAAEKTLCSLQHRLYMKSNKPDTFQALELSRAEHTPKPTRLKLSTDTYSSNPIKIIKEFCRCLVDLYQDTKAFEHTSADNLLFTLQLPTLSSSRRENLE